jgi:signal transduction histidine kinase/ligand-binding sensor domain-containing protein
LIPGFDPPQCLLYKEAVPTSIFRASKRGLPELLILALLCCCSTAWAALTKDFLVDTWRFDDDLPRDGIISIGQGKDGYLWVSSRYGLARFDGVRFANVDAQVGASFLGYHFATIKTDESGGMWLGIPGGGLVQWREGRFLHLVAPSNPVFGPVLAGLTNAQGRYLALTPDGRLFGWSNGVQQVIATVNRWGDPIPPSVCQDKDGNIWFATYEHKLVRVLGTNVEEMTFGEGEQQRHWIALQSAPSGEIWGGTHLDVGLWRGNKFEPLPRPKESFPVDDLIAIPVTTNAPSNPNSVSHSPKGRLWAIALGQAWLLEGNRWLTNVDFESKAGLYETSPRIVDSHGNLWLTTTKASIVRIDSKGGLLLLTDKDGLPPGRVASLYEDREGSIWAGVDHAGLARLRERIFTPLGAREGAKAPLVWAVVEDSAGAVWMGTENNGLHRWQEGKFTQFNLGNGGLPGSIYSLCVDRDGVVWAGTGEGGVLRFENGKFVPIWEYPELGWNKRVYVIYQDRKGAMWFGTGLGLFRWSNGTVRRIPPKEFEMGVARVMCEDVHGRLWVGMSAGAETRLAYVVGDELVPREQGGPVGNDILGLRPEPDGSLWIGTVGAGLWRKHEDRWQHYGVKEGLPDDRIYSIESDSAGYLWLGSPAGIFRLATRSIEDLDAGQTNRLQCLFFNRTDGLPTRECTGGSQPSIFHTHDGRLLFAMSEGVVAVAPGNIHVNDLLPPVIIEEIKVDGKEVSAIRSGKGASRGGFGLDKDAGLAIGPGHHVVDFRYTATSLIAPAKTRFKCRLEGAGPEWREMNSARSAMFNITSPGNYRFQVTACNNDGVWNEAGTEIALTVAPYLWQTWWFQAFAALLVLVTIAGSARLVERRKMYRKLEQFQRQQLVERERARIARDIHDEIGASLTEIGLLSEFAQRDSAATGQVSDDINKIAVKARSSTRALDEIVWAVNPSNDTFDGFISYACAYAEEQLRIANVRCRLDVASPPPTGALPPDVRHNLFMAFKEALNNAIKHAKASQVDIRVSADRQQLTVSVRDNGRGFVYDAASKTNGNGLSNMNQRLEAAGGRFKCDSTPGRGTAITMTLHMATNSPDRAGTKSSFT